MTCAACESAMLNRWCGMYRVDCLECSARAISQSPQYNAAMQADAITPEYRDVLQSVFGDGWKDGHERVKRWAKM